MIACPVIPLTSAQHIRQLDIHLRQRLLHPLNVSACIPHEIIALTPERPQPADLLRRPKRISQQPVGTQLHQPLALLHVALAPWQILRLSGIH
jgi:hypothetical protein